MCVIWLRGYYVDDMIKKRVCWFNQRWNVYLSSEGNYDQWQIKEILHKKDNGGEYRLTSYDIEGLTIYTFGLFLDNPKARPGHGGEWSSNSTNINEVFNINIIEIGVDGLAAAIDINVLKDLLGETFALVPSIYGMKFISADGNDGGYMEWRTLK